VCDDPVSEIESPNRAGEALPNAQIHGMLRKTTFLWCESSLEVREVSDYVKAAVRE